jgi:hypothetical protein
MTIRVVSALRHQHVEIAKAIHEAERRIDRLNVDLVHLDGAIRIFDPDAESTHRQAPARIFKHGHVHRETLDVVRQVGAPMTPRAIAERLIAERPEIARNARNLGDLSARVRKSLGRHHAGLLREKAGREASG